MVCSSLLSPRAWDRKWRLVDRFAEVENHQLALAHNGRGLNAFNVIALAIIGWIFKTGYGLRK